MHYHASREWAWIGSTPEEVDVDCPHGRLPDRASRYRHWKLAFDGPVATLAMDVAEDGGLRDGLQAEAQLLRPRRRHRARTTRSSASASSIPKCAAWSSPARATACSAPAPTSSCWALSSHAWKVNFCKFTNETRNGIEDASRQLRPQVHRRRQRHRAPAAATSWRSPATRSCWSTTARRAVSLPEVPLLGVLPGHRRAHAPHRQAPGAPRPAPTSSARSTEGVRGQRARTGGWSTRSRSRGEFAEAVRARARALAERSDRPRERAGRRADAARRATTTRDGYRLRARRRGDRPRRARRRRSRVRAPARRSRRTSRASQAAGARVVAARDGARARRRDPHAAHQRARRSARGSSTHRRRPRRRARRATRRCCARATTGSCARSRRCLAPHASRASTCRRARCSR